MRNPFQPNDFVIATGFKARRDDGRDSHFYGSSSLIHRWVSEQTLLRVENTRADAVRVKPHDGLGGMQSFHPAELRLATPGEVSATKTPPRERPQAGSVVRYNGTVWFVINGEPDGDGEVPIYPVSGGSSSYLRVVHPQADYEVLGQVMEDGDFRPAA